MKNILNFSENVTSDFVAGRSIREANIPTKNRSDLMRTERFLAFRKITPLFIIIIPLFISLVLVIFPFLFSLIWAAIAAITFHPVYKFVLRKNAGRRNSSAFITFSLILMLVIIPLSLIGIIAAQEASVIYEAIQFEERDVRSYFITIHDALPSFFRNAVDKAGYGTFDVFQARISLAVEESLGLIGSQFIYIGTGALSLLAGFVLGLYVTFFLIRDGEKIMTSMKSLLPIDDDILEPLFERSVSIVRATIKGSLVVGMVQGLIGSLTFWLVGLESIILLGVLMALASLLPAIGTGLIWVPIAAWLFISGQTAEALIVVFSGFFIIGLVDNLIRPILVGRDTGIPDWIILISTLGGISTMGISGIVIGPVIVGLFLACLSLLKDILETKESLPSN